MLIRLCEPSTRLVRKEPKLDHIRPFGAVCYAWIPKEKRGKQEPVREKCRLIGFGDDDDTEEMAGYKLLLESDQSVLYCNDVIFTKEENGSFARSRVLCTRII